MRFLLEPIFPLLRLVRRSDDRARASERHMRVALFRQKAQKLADAVVRVHSRSVVDDVAGSIKQDLIRHHALGALIQVLGHLIGCDPATFAVARHQLDPVANLDAQPVFVYD